jgi:hypothetical protein
MPKPRSNAVALLCWLFVLKTRAFPNAPSPVLQDIPKRAIAAVIDSVQSAFPELALLKWPNWTITKTGSRITCVRDEECAIPETCCHHPIVPGEKFCCTGWGRRKLVPALVAADNGRL